MVKNFNFETCFSFRGGLYCCTYFYIFNIVYEKCKFLFLIDKLDYNPKMLGELELYVAGFAELYIFNDGTH